jgi:hypothetical protein
VADNGKLLLLLGWHLLLTGLPAVAAALVAGRRVHSVPILLSIALAASGLIGILGFWTYYADKVLGESFSFLVILGSALLLGWYLYAGWVDRELLGQLAVPFALWALGSTFLVFFGFVHGGVDNPLYTSGTRFGGPLPSDNDIPHFFAEWLYQHGHHGTIPIFPGEWRFSDRPPLQTGYVLSQRAMGWDRYGLNYEVLGVVLQQLWILGFWSLLLAARVGRTTRALAVLVALLSPLAILNGFYVWPKLLPAAFLLAAAALVVTPLWQQVRRSFWASALVAALCGVAMLGHGSTVFGVIPLALVAAFRGLPSWRWLGVALAVGILFLVPWSAFQKWVDPPGNRLVKWTLAGVVEIDERGSLETIEDSYREVGLGGAIHNKAENFATISGGTMAPRMVESAIENGGLKQVVEAVRAADFFYLLPSLGLLLLGPVLMLVAALRRRITRGSPEWAFALSCLLVGVIGAVAWALLVFGNLEMRAVIHIGTYLLPLLGIAGSVAALRAVAPRFSVYYLLFAAGLNLAIYSPALLPPEGSSYSPLAAIAALAALAAFGAVAMLDGRRRAQET